MLSIPGLKLPRRNSCCRVRAWPLGCFGGSCGQITKFCFAVFGGWSKTDARQKGSGLTALAFAVWPPAAWRWLDHFAGSIVSVPDLP